MYIRSEDLGIQYIGPFPSRAAALAHIGEHFPAYRTEQKGYSDTVVDQIPEDWGWPAISPEQDAAMWAEERSWKEAELPLPTGPDPDKEFSLNGGDTWVTLDDIRQLWALLSPAEQNYVKEG